MTFFVMFIFALSGCVPQCRLKAITAPRLLWPFCGYAGDVVLKDLQLKAEALNALKLPLTVKAGFLGSVTLKVRKLVLAGILGCC